MAFFGEQQSNNLKYFCRICKKGFGCGRALGGHMRAHGICDENGYIDNQDQESDWEYNIGGGGGNSNNHTADPINKRMYALRTNPNRQKSCKSCENCGMEFISWKSFLEHGKCSSSKDAEPLMSLSGSECEDSSNGGRGTGWFKRKRSFRAKVENFGLGLNSNNNCPLSEEEDLANCLMMLSNATTVELEESSASAREEDERALQAPIFGDNHKAAIVVAPSSSKRLFECKACKKVFNSHQALGGHRASHKKVKGCFAARLDQHLEDEDETMQDVLFTSSKSNSALLKFDAPMASSPSKRKSKAHECSICHRIFSSGQALGGHKRCHWITSNLPETYAAVTNNKFHQSHDLMEKINQRLPNTEIDKSEALDLNFPVLHDEVAGTKRDSKNRLSFEAEVSTEIGLRPWMEPDQKKNGSTTKVTTTAISNEGNTEKASLQNAESEATSKVKLAKLSELDDNNLISGASSWLQVGISSSSTNNVGIDV